MKYSYKTWMITLSAIIAALFFAPSVKMNNMGFAGFGLVSWLMALNVGSYFLCLLCFIIPVALIAALIFVKSKKRALFSIIGYSAYIVFWLITVIALNGESLFGAPTITFWFILELMLAVVSVGLSCIELFGKNCKFGKAAAFVSQKAAVLSETKAGQVIKSKVDVISEAVNDDNGVTEGHAIRRRSGKYSNLFVRGQIYLEDEEFEKASVLFDRALDEEPKRGEYYLYLAMAEVGIKDTAAIRSNMNIMEANPNFKRYQRFATSEERELIYEKSICPKCGAATNSDMAFCCACGTPLEWN